MFHQLLMRLGRRTTPPATNHRRRCRLHDSLLDGCVGSHRPRPSIYFFSPATTYAHSASTSSGLSTSPHGGMFRTPYVTESTKRAWASRGNLRRSFSHSGLSSRGPWPVPPWVS